MGKSKFWLFLHSLSCLRSYNSTLTNRCLSSFPNQNAWQFKPNLIFQGFVSNSLYFWTDSLISSNNPLQDINHDSLYENAVALKSGNSYQRYSAMNNIMEISNHSTQESAVVSNYNIEVKDRLVYDPIYMLMFILTYVLSNSMIFLIFMHTYRISFTAYTVYDQCSHVTDLKYQEAHCTQKLYFP